MACWNSASMRKPRSVLIPDTTHNLDIDLSCSCHVCTAIYTIHTNDKENVFHNKEGNVL